MVDTNRLHPFSCSAFEDSRSSGEEVSGGTLGPSYRHARWCDGKMISIWNGSKKEAGGGR
eukprot:4333140-Pyramimonas_sp.AAC.1